MLLKDLIDHLGLEGQYKQQHLAYEISNGHVSDLLSEVLAFAPRDAVWITLQSHVNIVAVALMADIKAVIITGGRKPETEVMERARTEDLPIFWTEKNSFSIAGQLYQLLQRGD